MLISQLTSQISHRFFRCAILLKILSWNPTLKC